jgi:hypothetical protein
MSSLTSPITLPITFPKLALAGVAGQLSFEAYAWLVSPAVFGPTLEPAKLVTALTTLGTGIELSYMNAYILHSIIGASFVFLVWAMYRMTGLGLVLSGVVTGFALWFIAQGILAPVIGRPFMMEFGTYTQSSFVSHVGMTTIMALVLKWLIERDGATAEAT